MRYNFYETVGLSHLSESESKSHSCNLRVIPSSSKAKPAAQQRIQKMPCLSKPVKVETIITGVAHGADAELIGQVKSRVRLEDTNQDGQYTIVFCPIASRVGSDVEAAMQDIPSNKKVVLVLMHHTRDPDYSTAGRSWSEVYPNVDLEVHVLFHESVSGLLTCYKNTEAVYQMQEYLQPNGNYFQPSRNYFQPSRINSLHRYMILLGLLIVVFVVLLSLLLYFNKQNQLKIRQ